MLFSILIANYNNGKYFSDCYHSIISQSHPGWEVVIVDDKSTDNSVEIIKSLIGNDPRFRLYENEYNGGCGFTKNKCVSFANGEICGFLDPDDALLPDAVETMMNTHQAETNAVLVHSTFFYCDEFLKTTSIFSIAEKVTINNRFTNLEGHVSHFATFKKAIYLQTEGIDTSLQRAVDQDLYLKLSEKGSFAFVDKPLYKYRVHQQGIAAGNDLKAFYCHLKVIAAAEKRRGLNLEEEVSGQFRRKVNNGFLEENLANPRYLAGKMLQVFKKSPSKFFNKLFWK